MYNYLLVISYIGFDYKGFQKQKNEKNTIQHIILDAIESILKCKVKKSSYTGRTDAKVSALTQYFNFFVDLKINDENEFLKQINNMLPRDIFVLHFSKVDNSFSSRFNVEYKKYIYKIIPFNEDFVMNEYGLRNFTTIREHNKEIVLSKLNQFLLFFQGKKDYSSYYKPENNVNKNTLLELFVEYYVYDYPDFWVLTLEFKSVYFLKNMVRKIVGMLIAFLEEKVDLDYIRDTFENPNPAKGKYIALPEPLVLYSVKY